MRRWLVRLPELTHFCYASFTVNVSIGANYNHLTRNRLLRGKRRRGLYFWAPSCGLTVLPSRNLD
jgi:hypothetical protein